MNDLAVIIVSYNTRDLLRDCLNALPGGCGSLAVETFVVDNASHDGSPEMVAEEFPDVTLIRNPDNRGFAFANNVALAQITSRYAVLLNSDTVTRPDAFAELVCFMDENPECGYCGPKLLNGDGTHQASARRFPTPWSTAHAMLGFDRRNPASRHARDLHVVHGCDQPFAADWLCGACLLVRADAIAQVGPLDDDYFLYFEETDWCKRLADAGWSGGYVPSAEVVHFGGQSVNHADDNRPFAGDHPAHWAASSRRYFRAHHGRTGAAIAAYLPAALYALVWLKHRWQPGKKSKQKARNAAASARHLITVKTNPLEDRSPIRAPGASPGTKTESQPTTPAPVAAKESRAAGERP